MDLIPRNIFKLTDAVRPLIGPYKGKIAFVVKKEFMANQWWYTCWRSDDSEHIDELLFTESEIELAKKWNRS